LAPSELPTDPHLAAREMFFDVPSPWGVLRQLRLPVTPRGASPEPPPRVGQHTDAILRDAGLDDAEIASLRADKAAL
jgi:alpha-methylacyl-CoA racemase